MRHVILIWAALSALVPVQSIFAFTVEEAYKAIPHRQTPYRPNSSNLSSRDTRFLKKFFHHTDLAMAARVTRLSFLYHYKGSGGLGNDEYNRTMDNVLARLKSLKPPITLIKPYKLVLDSIKEQKAFFNKWANASRPEKKRLKKSYRNHPMVKSSHHKLIAAYNELMRVYPNETKRNQQAFFDHLCALDFI